MKKIIIVYIILIVAVLALAFFRGRFFNFFGKKNSVNSSSRASTATAVINGKTFNLMLAKSEQEQTTGLSGRASLNANSGMLFIFNTPGQYKFWMKDMKFPLDIIFINENKVVDIAENAPIPTTTNLNQLPRYQPKEAANKVLEINAGLSKKYNIKTGDTILFSNL